MEDGSVSTEEVPFEKLREPTRPVTVWCGGEPSQVERQISTLCQYCPNQRCPGTYEASSDLACQTLGQWRDGQMSLADAVRAKYRQDERHSRTDEFRAWVFNTLSNELTLDSNHWATARSELRSFAARVAKGQTAFGARRKCGPDDEYQIGTAVLDPLSDELCDLIEEKRQEMIDGEPTPHGGPLPVSEGERHTVEIIGIGSEGDGVAKIDGYVIIVPDAILGEEVTVEINATTTSVAFARIAHDE